VQPAPAALLKPGAALPAAERAPPELNVRANSGGDHSAKSKSAMAGMVVHAFVDGVALGAAVREGDSALGLLVFLAIMLHKAPSSFGLSSYLLHHGISHDGVKRRLAVFSSAAPLGAVCTYSLLSANLFTYKQEMLALCLLFSGGTFLYVACAHVLPEVQSGAHGGAEEGEDDDELHLGEDGGGGHGHSHGHGAKIAPRMTWFEVWLLVGGILFPLILDVHHGH
jgi:zinc transporter 9